MMTRHLFVGLLFLLSLLLPLVASAGEIILSAVGNGQWQISAAGLTNVHALDLDLRYDVQRLSGLTATAGAGLTGVMTAINDKIPGTIRLGVASTKPLAPSGIILKLHSSASGAEMVVNQFTVQAVDADGKAVPTTIRQQLTDLTPLSQTLSVVPTETAVSSSQSAQPLTLTRHHGGAVSGSVTFPVDNPPTVSTTGEDDGQMPPVTPPPATGQEGGTALTASSVAVIPASSGAEKHFHSQEEIVTAIERLPQPWTVANVKAIFLKPATASLARQKPPVAVADGKSKVSLYLLKSLSQKTPAVGVQGCTLGSIWDADEQGWEVEVITGKGIWPAKALLLGDGDLIQFPIVIVPALAITPPESDNAAIPYVDFNGDRSINALDAYLYVGNLLAQYGQ